MRSEIPFIHDLKGNDISWCTKSTNPRQIHDLLARVELPRKLQTISIQTFARNDDDDDNNHGDDFIFGLVEHYGVGPNDIIMVEIDPNKTRAVTSRILSDLFGGVAEGWKFETTVLTAFQVSISQPNRPEIEMLFLVPQSLGVWGSGVAT